MQFHRDLLMPIRLNLKMSGQFHRVTTLIYFNAKLQRSKDPSYQAPEPKRSTMLLTGFSLSGSLEAVCNPFVRYE
jgi:hypothetical protein